MPQTPLISTNWKQTKKFAVRQGLLGHVILQVEETRQVGRADYNGGMENPYIETRWRDAKLGDWIEYGFTN